MRLIFKGTLAITILLVLVMIPFAYLNVRAIETLLYEEAANTADIVGETIIRTTHNQMLENNRERVHQMIQEAGAQEGIERIRMITKGGRISCSKDPEEVGANLIAGSAACDVCHAMERPLEHASSMSRNRVFIDNPVRSMSGVTETIGDPGACYAGPCHFSPNQNRVYTDRSGKEVMGVTKAIYNRESCYTAPCHFHPPSQKILGVLDTVVSLEHMREQSREYTSRLILLTLSMLFVIGASLNLMIQKQVSQPLRELLNHTQRVGKLEFGAKIHRHSGDEIGDLSRSFNDMTEKLDHAREELEDWGHTLEDKVKERTRELKRTQDQLIQSEKLASLGEIVAGIAHELNNPLTGIIVFSSLLEKDERLSETNKADVSSIIHESQRCARIVKGLLEFSRISLPQKVMTNVNTVMDKTLALVGTQSIFHNVDIRTRYDDGIREILADPNQLEQVFVNIVLNAGQAMPGGGTLDIATGMDSGHVTVSVRDTGCGILPEHMARIFDPFFTTKEGVGTGLGLSVSYGIVQNHGGEIRVESAVGEGTEFLLRFRLPT